MMGQNFRTLLIFYFAKRISVISHVFVSYLFLSISNLSFAHEVLVKDLILYHPSLFVEKKGVGEAFFSVSNQGKNSDYIVGFDSQFSKGVSLLKYNEVSESFVSIGTNIDSYLDLEKSPLEITPGESITFDSLEYLLVFSDIDSNLNWFDIHRAIIFFKHSGQYEIDFEVEYDE